MIKTIAQALAILALAAGLSQAFIFPKIQDQLLAPIQQWEVKYLQEGTLELLARRLNPLTPELRAREIQALQTKFGFEIKLQTIDETAPPPLDLDLFQQTNTVADPASYSIHRLLNDKRQLLSFVSTKLPAAHLVNEAERNHMGLVAVLEETLRASTGEARRIKLEELAKLFEFSIKLVPFEAINLAEREKRALQLGDIVTTSNEASESADYAAEMVYKKIQQDVLIIGPLSEATLQRFYPVLVAYYLILATIVLLPLAIWIMPSWIATNELSRSSRSLGQGDFSVRVKERKGSKVNHLIAAFNSMAGKIQNLVESNKALINAVSHELRTPLSRIEFNLEIARSSDDPKEKNQQLDRIEDSVDELKTLVNEMLLYARFERETPNFGLDEVEIGEWLSQEKKSWDIFDPKLRIDIMTTPAPSHGMLERYYMSRAISNLVRNALRHAKSKVVVSHITHKRYVEIHVSDDGPGVDYHERTKIFEPFIRIEKSRNRDTGGSGLGLAIVKQIVHWHHGETWVEASQFGGAKFVVKWPKHPSNTQE